MLSEIGIIYLSDFNKDVIGKMLREKHLEFHPLFRAPLHVFTSRSNTAWPARRKSRWTI